PLAAVLGFLSSQRNYVYSDALKLWQDTLTQRPGNGRAPVELFHLAGDRFQAGDFGQAATGYRAVVEAANAPQELRETAGRNLGLTLGMSGDTDGGIRQLETAWQTDAERAAAVNTLGMLLLT